jgi:hypothetical protein
MKKIYLLGSIATLTLLFSGCALTQPSQPNASEMNKLDASKICKTPENSKGINATLKKANMYLKVAKKAKVEFRTRDVVNHKYISTSKDIALSKKLLAKGDLKKATFAAYQSCVQAIRAVQQKDEADKTYIMSVPK